MNTWKNKIALGALAIYCAIPSATLANDVEGMIAPLKEGGMTVYGWFQIGVLIVVLIWLCYQIIIDYINRKLSVTSYLSSIGALLGVYVFVPALIKAIQWVGEKMNMGAVF